MKALLNLPIKGKWFDLIAAGQKKEEYRTGENAQVRRAIWAVGVKRRGGDIRHVAIFRNGYRMDSRALAVEVVGIDLRGTGAAEHPEWGEPEDGWGTIIIRLGDVLKIGPYSVVKDFVGGLKYLSEARND